MNNSVRPLPLLGKTLLLFFVLQAWLHVWIGAGSGVPTVFSVASLQRERFPLSTVAPLDSALDVGRLDAMFASHVISTPKQPDEFRVLVLGDSTVWGLQFGPEKVLPGQLNNLGLACGSRGMRFYNLSFPRSSATKDLLILDRALEHDPDAIVWLVTWYTLSPKTRVDHWLIEQNQAAYVKLATRFDFLPRDFHAPSLAQRVFDDDRALFRAVRFQVYAPIQLATAQDQIPGPPQVREPGLSADLTFEGLKPPTLRPGQVSLDQVQDFEDMAGHIPVLLVNEPILIRQGVPNSDARYNSYYPRWVYDQYRTYLSDAATAHSWSFLDLWNLFPEEAFADTPLHLTAEGHAQLARRMAPAIRAMCAGVSGPS